MRSVPADVVVIRRLDFHLHPILVQFFAFVIAIRDIRRGRKLSMVAVAFGVPNPLELACKIAWSGGHSRRRKRVHARPSVPGTTTTPREGRGLTYRVFWESLAGNRFLLYWNLFSLVLWLEAVFVLTTFVRKVGALHRFVDFVPPASEAVVFQQSYKATAFRKLTVDEVVVGVMFQLNIFNCPPEGFEVYI